MPLRETEASKRGQVFATADGGILPNMGERLVSMYTAEGVPTNAK